MAVARELWEVEAAGANSSDSVLKVGNIEFKSLPTTDPGVVGQLYNDSGTVKVSAG